MISQHVLVSYELLHVLLIVSGIGHVLLSIGSLLVPRILNWKRELGALPLLLRQMFWTYAGYILVINLCFGVLSLVGTDDLLDKSFLAKSVCLFISGYWLSRIVIQFLYFDTSSAPKGLKYTVAEIVLVLGFLFFAITYLLAFVYNLS